MNKLLIRAAMAILPICSTAQPKQSLTLLMESGTKIVYLLEKEPNIEFDGQDMLVIIEQASDRIPMHDVQCWQIGVNDEAEAEAAQSDGCASITVSGNSLRIFNPGRQPISIFDINGKAIGSSADEHAQFELKRGAYIVKIANKTHKIAIL